MINNKTAAIILAAGQGTRMKSKMPKVMHKIADLPMINHVIDTCKKTSIHDICVIVAPNMGDVTAAVAPYQTVIQDRPLGTGHAALAAKESLKNYDGYIFILNGDGPFIRPETLNSLYKSAQKTGLAVLGFEASPPHAYGRLITDNDIVTEIIEDKDCKPDQKNINYCNSGVYCVRGDLLFDLLDQITDNNAQGEYYLTDMVSIAAQKGIKCTYDIASEDEVMGINSRAQLAQAEQVMQNHLRHKAMQNGVTMIDPNTVYLSMDTQFDQDVIIEPNVVIGPGVTVGQGTVIHAFSHIEGAEIGQNTSIGPFARIRPKSKIGDGAVAGNFIEVNRSEMKSGSKSKHLSYLGDAIIGEKSNIGAGTVIANYDGYNKHDTSIGVGAFIGSNTTIISPVTIGDKAITAAGSTITKDVPSDAMAVGRVKQTTLNGYAKTYHEGKDKK